MAQETNTNHSTESWREKAPTRALLLTLVGVTLLVAFAMAGSWPLGDWANIKRNFSVYKGGKFQSVDNQAPVLRDKPKLQVDEKADISEYRKMENDRLHHYKKNADGSVQIPVERAMKLLVEKGLPARKGNQ